MGEIRIGTASWTDKTLLASGWYPPEADTPEKRLRYYARQFPLVEVDATYYALPAESTARSWAERTPAGFTFNVKAFSLFTQHPTRVAALPADLREAAGRGGKDRVYLKDVDPEVADQAWQRFLAALEPLEAAGKLGAILLQFPPWFPISRGGKDYILACAQRTAPRRVCVEFRNRTWMTPDNQKETLGFLAEHRLPYVCVDMPQGYPSSIPPVLAATSDLALVRMHGHSDRWDSKDIYERFGYRYRREELAEWAGRIRGLADDAEVTHVLFNNCYRNYAQVNAAEFAERLGGLPAELPPDLALDPVQHRRHAAQPQRADQVLQPEPAGELRGRAEHLLGTEPVQAGLQDGGEAPGRGRLRRRVEEQVHGLVRRDLDGQEQRGLALRHRLEQVVPLGVPRGQRGQFLRELEQQLQPVLVRHRVEVVDDLLQPGVQRGGGHGLSPRVIGTRTLFPHSVQDPS
jgi:uncharacterized protein YecE (DUF72 family)